MSKQLRNNIISFLFFTIVQIVIFQNFNLSEWGFAFIYVGFILFLPIDLPIIFLLCLAFFQGIILDVFYNTLGLHTFCLVFVAYIRSFFLRTLAPKTIEDLSNVNSVKEFGIQRVIIYTFVVIFIHHVILFFIMDNGLNYFLSTLLKILISSVVSSFVIIFIRKVFFNSL